VISQEPTGMAKSGQSGVAAKACHWPIRRMSAAGEQPEAAAFSWCKNGFVAYAAVVGAAAQAIGPEFAIHRASSADERSPCDPSRKGGFLADAHAI
jgi:hypothetical protein